MRAIASARRWPLALGLAIGIGLLNGLAGLTAPQPSGRPPSSLVPPGLLPALAASRSLGWAIASGLLGPPLLLAIEAGLLYVIGRLLGGRGAFSGLLAALGFSSVPSLLEAPVIAWLNLAGGAFAALSSLVGLGFGLWVLALDALAVRESLALSTGRALAALLLLLAGLVVLAISVGIVFAARLSIQARAPGPV